ncbi:helix-turn-helix domain-containing protein [Catellatospora sp. IY07-71]|uniref:helix-turn-helix domain-containing protein n=1 Tax=Catellatospora sp. IY07-71 TaxID=2728827 RepID=UPI001FD5336F|nr:helix-turn-helix domain-containing protein [Catellatospora sp. IY07-71]
MSDVAGGVVVQAYRFALDPTPAQDRDLHRHAGAGRFAFNWALAAAALVPARLAGHHAGAGARRVRRRLRADRPARRGGVRDRAPRRRRIPRGRRTLADRAVQPARRSPDGHRTRRRTRPAHTGLHG